MLKKFAPINLKTYLANLNDFKLFDETLTYIHNKSLEIYNHLLSSLTKNKLQTLNLLKNFQKIKLTNNKDKSNNISVQNDSIKFRKIIKIKRK